MAMLKKLSLITAMVLGINAQLCASENQSETNLLSFANSLDKIPSAEPKNIASWIRNTFYGTSQHNQDVTEQLKDIVNSNVPLTEKTQSIKQIWTQETTPKEENNQSYFSSVSSYTKAAAAFIVAAGIASYFYFMRPWSSSTE